MDDKYKLEAYNEIKLHLEKETVKLREKQKENKRLTQYDIGKLDTLIKIDSFITLFEIGKLSDHIKERNNQE